MERTRKSVIFIAVLTFFYAIYFWGLPYLINIEKRVDFVEQQIKEKIGYNIKLEQPKIKMGIIPAVWLMAEKVTLLNDDNTKALEFKHSALKINLLPLIAGKIQVGNFSSDSILANFVYTKDDELKIGQYPLVNNVQSKMILSKAYVRLGNYRINLKDYKQSKDIILDGTYLVLDEFKRDKKLKLSTFAKLFVNQKESEIMTDIDINLPLNKITENQFKINGHITKLDLSDLSAYIRALPQSNINNISGKIDTLADTVQNGKHKKVFLKTTISDLNIEFKDKPKAQSIFCKDIVKITANALTIKNGLDLENFKILSKGIDVDIKGKITKLNSKKPDLDMDLNINNSRTEKFTALMLPDSESSPDFDFAALKETPFYSDISGFLHMKGSANSPDVIGKMSITEGYIDKPLNAPKATIIIDFLGEKLYMDVKVPAPNKEAVFVKGDVELYGEQLADLMITSTDKVDLKSTQLVLNPLHRALKFDIGPVPIMDIKGIGNINLHVTGNKDNPHAKGYFNFINTTASFLDINNLTIKNANGTLDFDNQDTHFYTKTGFTNGRPISIDGKCNLKGVLDFDVNTKGQDLGDLLKIVTTSPMLKEIQSLVEPLSMASGKSDFCLKLTGKVPDVNDIKFNKNLFAKGFIDLYGAYIKIYNVPLSNITGKVSFDNLKTDFNLISNLDSSNIKIVGQLDDKNANLNINSDRFVVKDGLKLLKLDVPYKDDIGKIHSVFKASYNGNIDKIDFNNLKINGKIYASKGKIFSINDSTFDINGSNLKTSNISGYYKNNPYSINLHVVNLAKPLVNGEFNIQNFNLASLDELRRYIKIKDFRKFSGVVNLKGKIRNNEIDTDINLANVSFMYRPLYIRINNGRAQFKNNTLYLNKISSHISDMPLSVNGKITNIYKNPMFNLVVNIKPNQNIVDQIFNNKALYPIKLKGDINCTDVISGNLKAIHNNIYIKLNEDSSIYYMGATIGNKPTLLHVDSIISPNNLKLNNLQYYQTLQSQKNLLDASGEIQFYKNNDLVFKNLKIKTNYPTDAKIFNIIFRKPFMKHGTFTSDINISGNISSPVILGKLNINEINMPLVDAVVNDIALDFKKDKIYLHSKGTVLTNDLKISAVIKNSFKSPLIFEDVKVNLETLNINKIATALREYDVDSVRNASLDNNPFNLHQIIIKNSEIMANNIQIKNLQAKDFSSHVTLNEKMLLNVDNFKFMMADGYVTGNIKYNLLNNLVNLTMDMKNTNAQILANTLFDLNNQIYGSITGNLNLYCNGKSHDTCMQTLGGNVKFNVSDGKMPKLGSLEYLLKAGNLLKSGVTGLSITGIIDLITPYKTGEFEKITGNIKISNGVANDIQIFSAGKALNIYIKGSCNLINQIADMQIYGALTKNFSTILGKIGNASLNTLFNTIPGVNISESPSVITEDIAKIPNSKDNVSRIFNAIIYGDINGNDYVKSFGWLK